MTNSQKCIPVALILCALTILAAGASAQRRAVAPYEPPDPDPLIGQSNLFLHAPVTASGHWADKVPEYAVDGRRDDPALHWAAENIPVWLRIDLGSPHDLNTIRIWTYWPDGRTYRYYIEGSIDGDAWITLADKRDNRDPATQEGALLAFPAQKVRYVRVTFTYSSAGAASGGHIIEIEGYSLGADSAALLRVASAWDSVQPGLNGAVATIDRRYARNLPPEPFAQQPALQVSRQTWTGTAWRGERVNAQLVLWSTARAEQLRLETMPFRNAHGDTLAVGSVHPWFERYVLADGRLEPDVLDTATEITMAPRTTRPVWVTIDVPANAAPGKYRGQVIARAAGGASHAFPLEVEVLALELPPPAKWAIHLDIWQNPYAVARYHHVAPWSEEHFRLLEPHLRMLAQAGQKCLTTTIIDRPWGTQTYDPYGSMVEWIRKADGSWKFDYTVFDRYVEFAAKCGLDRQINCYSMVPWSNTVRHLDERTGDYVEEDVRPGTVAFERHWAPFLTDFVRHLREKGWLSRTAIAMDERPLNLMMPTIALVRRVAPELKIALAGDNQPLLKSSIDDWCVYLTPPLDAATIQQRLAAGRPTTFYICCTPDKPNTFVSSPPAESAWLGWYAAANGYSGILRWAYDCWVEDPLYDTSHVTWPAGDCFLVYPGPRSSIRFERLREGIEQYEKVRILRGMPSIRSTEQMAALKLALARFTLPLIQKYPADQFVEEATRAIDAVSRVAAARVAAPAVTARSTTVHSVAR